MAIKKIITNQSFSEEDFKVIPLSGKNKIALKQPLNSEALMPLFSVPPKTYDLVGAKNNDITPDPRNFMRRLFVNPITGHGFLRIAFTANKTDCDDAYDMGNLPPGFIRASDLVDDGAGEVWLLPPKNGHKIGFKGLTVGRKYHILLHGFWDLNQNG